MSSSLKKSSVLLFDLDGTLLASIPVILQSFRETFKELAYPYPGDEVIAAGIGSHLNDIFTPLLPPSLKERALLAYRSIYIKKQRSGEVQLIPHVSDVLKALFTKGQQMGVVTTKLRVVSQELLEQLGVKTYFTVIVGSEDVSRWKPDPDPLLLAAEKMNILPRDCTYIGDSLHDAQSAEAAGMRFIGVTTGTGKKSELTKYGEVFSTLTEFYQRYQ